MPNISTWIRQVLATLSSILSQLRLFNFKANSPPTEPTIKVIIDGEEKELGLKDVVRLLLQRAEDIASKPLLRRYSSAMRRAMIDVTNAILEGIGTWETKHGQHRDRRDIDYGAILRAIPWGDEMMAARDYMIELLDSLETDEAVRTIIKEHCQNQYGVVL